MPLTLAELAIHIPASVQVFEKYGLDYYQSGKETLRNACAEKALSFEKIDAEIAAIQKLHPEPYPISLEETSIERIIDFVNGQYHSSEEQTLNTIDTQLKNMLSLLDKNLPSYTAFEAIYQKFIRLKEKLNRHCKKEDEILFPYMRKLTELYRDKSAISSMKDISLVKNPIRMLKAEHIQAAAILNEIKEAIRHFQPPENISETYTKLFGLMKEFELDLHMHLHIENNILFPKLLMVEEELNQRYK